MNLILLTDDDFAESSRRVRLRGRRAVHVRTVHRAEVGAVLRVGRLGGLMGSGVVTARDDDSVELEVSLDQEPPAPLPVTLLLALPRPKVLRRVLQAVAGMGVKRLVLLHTWRVEKSFWQSPWLEPEALREQLMLGLEQGCDTVLPDVQLRRRFKPFVEDELPALIADSRALVAHPAAASPCPRLESQPVTLAIGPEGGFIPYEVERLCEAGFAAVTLGPRRLRVEQAVVAVLARLFG